jgi:hypothetical protein
MDSCGVDVAFPHYGYFMGEREKSSDLNLLLLLWGSGRKALYYLATHKSFCDDVMRSSKLLFEIAEAVLIF